MSSTGSRSLRTSRSRSRRAHGGVGANPDASSSAGADPRSDTHRRSSAYRAETREAAAAAYHSDALVMARMGYVPESEAWSTQLEQVLVVGYVHAPDRTPQVLEALKQAKVDESDMSAQVAAQVPPRQGLPNRLRAMLPLEVRLLGTGVGGAVAGVVVCLLLAALSGERPGSAIVGGFAILGIMIGFMVVFAEE